MKTARTHIGITVVLLILLSVLGGCGIGQPPATEPDPSAATAESTGYSTTASTTAETIGQTIQTTTVATATATDVTTAATTRRTQRPLTDRDFEEGTIVLEYILVTVDQTDDKKTYTADDFPDMNILRVEKMTYRTDMYYVYLRVPGKEQLLNALEKAQELPFVKYVNYDGYAFP